MTGEQIAITYVVYCVLCAGAGGFVASLKNRSVGQWMLLSFLLGVMGILILAALPEKQAGTDEGGSGHGSRVLCKECGKLWHPNALKNGVCNACQRRRLNLKLKGPSRPA